MTIILYRTDLIERFSDLPIEEIEHHYFERHLLSNDIFLRAYLIIFVGEKEIKILKDRFGNCTDKVVSKIYLERMIIRD